MHYINGQWLTSGSHEFTSLNPANGEVLWKGMAAGEVEITAAVKAAHAAFPAWAAMPYQARYAICERFKQLVEAKKDELSLVISKETGKAPWDAKSEVAAVIAKLTYAHEAYHERTGLKIKESPVGRSVVRHRPHGVMAVYGPYNFPAHLPNGHIMPALLAGNTILFKSSEQTPMVAEWMVKLWAEAGVPPGVLNLVQGEKDTGVYLSKSHINGLLFTGSSVTGKLLHAQFAGRPEIILALEMGGNNPLIVGEVSNLKAAVHETLLSAFTGTGQRCTCARRLIVIRSSNSDTYMDALVRSAAQLKAGSYDEIPEPFMGPLISIREAKRLLEAQERLENLGAKVLLRMRNLKPETPFVSPAILDVTGIKSLPDEEYFGPMLQVIFVPSIEAAVTVANQTAFGLSASLFTDNQAQYQYVISHLHAGLLNLNRQTTGASGAGPFGGVGVSGNHRPAGYYSADYCSYPVASVENLALNLPEKLPPGMVVEG